MLLGLWDPFCLTVQGCPQQLSIAGSPKLSALAFASPGVVLLLFFLLLRATYDFLRDVYLVLF